MSRQQLVEMVAATGAKTKTEIVGVLESYKPNSLPGKAAEKFFFSETDDAKYSRKLERLVRDVKKVAWKA